MLTIYLDLDGTLLDVSERYWQLHSALVRRHGLEAIERPRFWGLKRSKARLAEIAGSDPARQRAYWRDWLQLIEAPEYLAYDRLIDGAGDALMSLSSRHRLVLATMRKNKASLMGQLSRLRLAQFFSAIVYDDQAMAGRGKGTLIAVAGALAHGRGLVAGDTEEDVQAGRALGVETIGVLTGLRDAGMLTAAGAGILADSIRDLPAIIAAVEREEGAKHAPAPPLLI